MQRSALRRIWGVRPPSFQRRVDFVLAPYVSLNAAIALWLLLIAFLLLVYLLALLRVRMGPCKSHVRQ
jgi:hypothetical protein